MKRGDSQPDTGDSGDSQPGAGDGAPGQDDLYRAAATGFGPALERLAHAYEREPEARRDLIQDIHLALWKSFRTFDGRCSLRTWVYRVAHNTGASHVTRAISFRRHTLVTLDELEGSAFDARPPGDVDRQLTLERLYALVRQLDPVDRQIVISYLEGMEAAEIAEILGVQKGAVATRIYRAKRLLAARLRRTLP